MLMYSYSIKTIYRLSTFQDFGWNSQVARDTFDLVDCMEQAVVKAQQANAMLKEETGEESVFAVAAENMMAMAGNWRLPHEHGTNEVLREGGATGWTVAGLEGLDLPTFDFSNDYWLSGTFSF